MTTPRGYSFPFHFSKVKWDYENDIYYYRIFGNSIEHDEKIEKFETMDAVIASNLFTCKKGNGGFERFMAGAKTCMIDYDIWFLNRDVHGYIIKPVVPIQIEKEQDKLIITAILEDVGASEKEIIALDTEFVQDKDNSSLSNVTEIGLVSGNGEIIYDIRYANVCEYKKDEVVIKEYLRDKVVIGHSVGGDIKVLKIDEEISTYDISSKFLDEYGRPYRLKHLVNFFFGVKIQSVRQKHRAVIDAYYTMKMLYVFPGITKVFLPRDVVSYVCKQGGGHTGHERLMIKEEEDRQAYFEFVRREEESRICRIEEKKNKFSAFKFFSKSDFDIGGVGKYEEGALLNMLKNIENEEPLFFVNEKDVIVMDIARTDRDLYELSFDPGIGWIVVACDDFILDSENVFGVLNSRMVLSKDDVVFRKWNSMYDKVEGFRDYFEILYDVKMDTDLMFQARHNYVKIDFVEVLRDYHTQSVIKYIEFCLKYEKSLLVWGFLDEWMMVIDII